jgi:plasmid stabilization system protein ParE
MIVYAPRALRDLQTIEAYIQQFNAPAARRVITAIKRAIDTLGSFPNIGVVKNEAGHRRINVRRSYGQNNYRTLVTSDVRRVAASPLPFFMKNRLIVFERAAPANARLSNRARQ